MADLDEMDVIDFNLAFRGEPANDLRTLTHRFNYAFRKTREIGDAMAAVNEVLERPIGYLEFLEMLRERD